MFLTRDQQIACDVTREYGYNPSSILTLTSRSRKHNGAVISVSGIKDGARYNLRVVVRKTSGTLLSVDKLVPEFLKVSHVVRECVIKTISRIPVLIKE
jgi:hypothetical protein